MATHRAAGDYAFQGPRRAQPLTGTLDNLFEVRHWYSGQGRVSCW
jgi:hypothetical protein